MNSLTFAAQVKPVPLEELGHRFRGAMIDKCGLVERWATGILAADSNPKSSKYLFGQKLGAVRALANVSPAASSKSLLKHPQRVVLLLDRFQPYAELRASLAHAVQTIAIRPDGEPLFIYQPVCGRSKALSLTLTVDAQKKILSATSFFAKLLTDQHLREG